MESLVTFEIFTMTPGLLIEGGGFEIRLCINPFLEAVDVKKPCGNRVAVEDSSFQCVDSLAERKQRGDDIRNSSATYPQRRQLAGEFDEDRGLIRDASVDVDSLDTAILNKSKV